MIWNTTTYKTEGVLTNNGKWGQITYLTWLHIDKPIDNKSVALAVGTGVEAMSFDHSGI